jgi:hypothetical protein
MSETPPPNHLYHRQFNLGRSLAYNAAEVELGGCAPEIPEGNAASKGDVISATGIALWILI